MLAKLSGRTIKFRLTLLFGAPLSALVVVALIMVGSLSSIESSFQEFNEAGVQSQKYTLMISRDMNYVSRLTRSIMLADDYQKNMDKLEKRIADIYGHFRNLQNSTAAISDENFARSYRQAIKNAESDTRAFLEDGRTRMHALANRQRTDSLLKQTWLDYKKAASPLANKARKSFAELTGMEDEYLHTVQANAKNSIATLSTSMNYIVIATTIVTLFFGLLIIRSIVNPIKKLQLTIQRIAEKSDLTERIQMTGKDELAKTAQSFDRMLESFHHIVNEIRSSTQQLSHASEQMNDVTVSTSSGVKNQSMQLEQVATAMNEMTATVQEVSQHAADAAAAAQGADDDAEQGQQVVNSTIVTIDALAKEIGRANEVIAQLNEKSNAIGSVVDVIQGVAEQTNLLALNAAIEAARAGEHGRGFAVVADEVRILASRTQESTQEIQQMIESLQQGTSSAVDVMSSSRSQAEQSVHTAKTAGDSLKAITQAVARIRQMNDQIASAAEEQRCVAEEINESIINISGISDTTASGAEQTSAASEQVNQLAHGLQKLTGQFVIAKH